MPKFHANIGPFYCDHCTFIPNGKLHWVGDRTNPVGQHLGRNSISARMFVGFNVGGHPKYHLKDLVPIIVRVREKQTGDPSASFVAQTGVYKHHDGPVVTEKSAQVLIFSGETEKKLTREMVELAETVAKKLHQESVIVEIQRGGVTQDSFFVSP